MLHLKIKNKLKQSGLAITKHRSKILGVMFRLAKPSSLKDIRSSLGLMDRVTVFRILNSFEKNNIIHVISLQDGSKLYALCDDKCNSLKVCHSTEHIHFKCDSCSDVSCVPLNKFPEINIANHFVSKVNINVSGICVNCFA